MLEGLAIHYIRRQSWEYDLSLARVAPHPLIGLIGRMTMANEPKRKEPDIPEPQPDIKPDPGPKKFLRIGFA
jgi:hypothetical protein